MRQISLNMVFTSLNALTFWDTVDYMLDNMGVFPLAITFALYNNGLGNGPWDLRHLSIDYQNLVLEKMNQPQFKSIRGWQNIHDYLAARIHVSLPGYSSNKAQPWSELD